MKFFRLTCLGLLTIVAVFNSSIAAAQVPTVSVHRFKTLGNPPPNDPRMMIVKIDGKTFYAICDHNGQPYPYRRWSVVTVGVVTQTEGTPPLYTAPDSAWTGTILPSGEGEDVFQAASGGQYLDLGSYGLSAWPCLPYPWISSK
ncbi:MAG: hypothetical protein K1X79_10555 [Oligoflexia bacterium]|nr:hypothetical protein [Oligoflexia bacterium]